MLELVLIALVLTGVALALAMLWLMRRDRRGGAEHDEAVIWERRWRQRDQPASRISGKPRLIEGSTPPRA
jgi:hypothetical protein